MARGVQVAGIVLCVMDDRELTECLCFIDLALAETKDRAGQILVAAMSDWTGLGAMLETCGSPGKGCTFPDRMRFSSKGRRCSVGREGTPRCSP